MSQFRAKRLDIGCFVNKWVIRDHTKRKVFAEYETERYVSSAFRFRIGAKRASLASGDSGLLEEEWLGVRSLGTEADLLACFHLDKPSDTLSEIPPFPPACALKPN